MQMISFGVVICMVLPCVMGLRCLQCSTVVHNVKEECRLGNFSPQQCPGNASYCIKYEGVHQNINFVFRGCSDTDFVTGCRLHNITHNAVVTMCFYACKEDGCNSGKILQTGIMKYLILVIFVWDMLS